MQRELSAEPDIAYHGESLLHQGSNSNQSGLSNGNKTNGNGSLRRSASLGWFSLGLGMAELVAPRSLGRLIGAGDDAQTCTTLRALGLREVASGIGILTRPEPAPWLWARVAGDLMDLAFLGSSVGKRRSSSKRLLAASAAIVGVGVVDGLVALERTRRISGDGARDAAAEERTFVVKKSITINRPADEVYRFWRNLANHARFMAHLESVEMHGQRSHWRAKSPLGTRLEWDAEIYEDEPNERLSWRSLPGSRFENQGSVQFLPAPGGRGTELRIELHYRAPLGIAGFSLAKMFGAAPKLQIENDLRRLKQIVETGSVVHSDASIHRGPHPARPAAESEDTTSAVEP
jgi:uncharacterized membrane protein